MDKYEMGLCWAARAVILSLIAIFAALCADDLADAYWQREAIDHGAAQYNPKTGDWEWLPREEGE